MNTKSLQNLGLTEREAEIYLILLDTGSTTTGQIIKKSGLHKATVYSILQRLIDQGLVSYVIKDGIRYFEAADPDTLLNVLREREENLLEVLPELKRRKDSAKQKQKITVFEGWKGMETVYGMLSNTLQKGETYYAFGASKGEDEKRTQIFFNKFVKKTSKKGIKQKVIFNETARGNIAEQYNYPDLYEAKHMPYTTPAEVGICRDKALITILEKNPTTILIDDKKVSESFKNYFNLLWNQDVKVYKGFDAVTEKFASILDVSRGGESYYVLNASFSQGGKRFSDWLIGYHKNRIKKKVRANLLAIPKDYKQIVSNISAAGDPEMKLSEVRILPPQFSSPMPIILYGRDRALIFLLGEDLICFEVQSKELYKSFKTYFDTLWEQETQTLKGFEAVWDLFEEVSKSKNACLLGARGYYFDFYPKDLKKFEELLDKNKTKIRNIVDFGAKGHPILSIKGMDVRYVPNEFRNPSVIWIYSNKIAISQWTEKEPIILRINNKNVYESYKKQFELLWKSASK